MRRYRRGAWSVIEATGPLDREVAPLLREFVEESSSRWIVFDLRGVHYLDGDVLGVLAFAWRRVHPRAGEVRLVGATGSVLEILQASLLSEVLHGFPSLTSATREPPGAREHRPADSTGEPRR